MNLNQQQLNDISIKTEFSLSNQDLKPHVEKAASHLALHKNIPGFRPGKAPLSVVEKHIGKDTIFSEALELAINQAVTNFVQEQDLDLYYETDFKLLKSDPDDVRFEITFITWPKINLNSWDNTTITAKQPEVTASEIDEAVQGLLNMLAQDEVVSREIKKQDKAEIDFDVSVDGKVIDGGVGRNFAIIIGENKMIPGFEDKLVGHKPGDEFTFELNFPNNYTPKLSGKKAEFKVKIHKVYNRTIPELTDDLAKKLGEQSAAGLKSRLRQNLLDDKSLQEQDRVEIEALRHVTAIATVGTLPQRALDAEHKKLIAEIEHDLLHQQTTLNDYLATKGLTKEQWEQQLLPQAKERLTTSLVLRQIAKDHNLDVTDQELEYELRQHKAHYATNKEVMDEINKPSYVDYLRMRLINRKAISFIKNKLVKSPSIAA